VQSSLAAEQLQEADGDGLEAALQRTFSSPTYDPPTLPAVAMEAMQLASRPSVKSGGTQRRPATGPRCWRTGRLPVGSSRLS
jgi:hypothetical protein